MKIKKCKKIDYCTTLITINWKIYHLQIILERKAHLAIFALPKEKGLIS